MINLNRPHNLMAVVFLLPFFLYEDLILAAMIFVAGMVIIWLEQFRERLSTLQPREYLFFLFMFHMLFGERNFAYLGLEPIFITEVMIACLAFLYRRELLQVHRNLLIYYILVAFGLLWGLAYVYDYRIDALRDSLMLVYAIWVPIIYHVFARRKSYDLFFDLLKLFIVLKAIAYLYEGAMILMGLQRIVFEGFRFNVGYVVPSLVVLTIFLPFRHIGLPYKILALMMIPAVFTLFHRSIFLGLFLAILILFIAGRVPVKKMVLAYGTASIVLLGSFLVYYNELVDVDLFLILEEKTRTDEGNINYRLEAWDKVMEKYYEHAILGYGVGRPVMYVYANVFYDTVDLDYFDVRDLGGNVQPHNSYLNVLTRFGIIIFPFFLYALWKPVERLIIMAKTNKSNGEQFLRLLLIAGFLAVIYVFAFFNVVLESPHHAFPFWLVIAMALAFGRRRNSPPKKIVVEKVNGNSGDKGGSADGDRDRGGEQ